VQPFPATGAKYQISVTSCCPLWSPDGMELFYLTTTYDLFVVDLITQPRFRFGNPMMLPPKLLTAMTFAPRSHDITPDGKRFISVIDPGEPSKREASEMHVVLNWFEELKQRVPTK
jgi:hypothetical protein